MPINNPIYPDNKIYKGIYNPLESPAPTVFNAAVFDGTNDYMAITGTPNAVMPSSTDGTFVCYVKRSSTTAATIFRLESAAVVTSLVIRWAAATANLVCTLTDASAGSIFSIIPGVAIPNDGKYHRLWLGWQSNDGGLDTAAELKIDGVSILTVIGNAGPVDYSVCDRTNVGATQAGANRINGAIGLLGLYTSYFADSNFGNPDNTPKSLPANGSISSINPMIWLPQGGNSFALNGAVGGNNYVVTGSLVSEVINV